MAGLFYKRSEVNSFLKFYYNNRGIYYHLYKNGSWGCRVLLPLVILKGRTNKLTKILIVFNLEVLWTAWDERNPCAVSRRKKTVVNDRVGIKTLSSGQKLKCSSSSRGWNAVVRTGNKMLKSKQELKISKFVSPRICWFRRKDEWWKIISQTPMVHKLDEVSSWCLADCSKYVCVCVCVCVRERERERERERVSEEESVKKSECGLSCWLVLPAARKRRDRSVLIERPAWKRVKECYFAFL